MIAAPPDRITIRRVSAPHEEPWQVWIPPRGPQDYDGGDPDESPIFAPFGDTYWDSFEGAVTFVDQVIREYDLAPAIHPECLRFGYIQDGRCCGHAPEED